MLPPASVESFRSAPFVCGYVGPGDDSLWSRLRAAAPTGLTATWSGPHHAVAASTAPLLERARRSWTWGRYVVDGRRPSDWRDASHELGLAGIWSSTSSTRLHTDVSGLHDLFHRRVGDTVYFATRIAPLRDLAAGLRTDWDGWGASLAFGGFIGSATPFREIRRLQPGESIRYDGNGISLDQDVPAWLERTPPTAGTEEVTAAIRAALPGRRTRTRHHVPLSGGWDSRLIALAMVRNRARPPMAWTADPDTGQLDDIEMARSVAAALRLEHEVVTSEDHFWGRERPAMLARVEHLTWLHTWLGPLSGRMRSTSSVVVDGLGGDVLLRNLFVGETLLAAPSDEERLRIQFEELGGARVGARSGLLPALARRWAATSYDQMRRAGDRWSGHPSEFVLRALGVRTSRVIAASPMRLFAPEARVLLPFMDPRALRAALAVPVAAKADRSLYRGLLAGLHPRVGPMPSTNDGLPPTRAGRPRSQMRRTALTPMASAVLADPVVLGLLAPTTAQRLSGPVDRTLLTEVPHSLLQWASSLADWRAVNRAHLRADDGPG